MKLLDYGTDPFSGIFSTLFLGLMLLGCGTLNRDLSFNDLTIKDREYIRESVRRTELKINFRFGERHFLTYNSVRKYYFLPPITWLVAAGYEDGQYSYAKDVEIFPIYLYSKGSVYDRDGKVNGRVSGVYYCPIWGSSSYEDYDRDNTWNSLSVLPFPGVLDLYKKTESKHSGEVVSYRKEFLRIPIILGPCFSVRHGPESGRPRFLWVPCGKKE